MLATSIYPGEPVHERFFGGQRSAAGLRSLYAPEGFPYHRRMTANAVNRRDDGRGLIVLAALVIVAAWIYAQGLPGQFILDDATNLGSLTLLDEGASVADVMSSNRSTRLGRPISMLTFAFDYWRAGMSPGAMKTTNIALHLLSGMLLFSFLFLLLLTQLERRQAWAFALTVAAIWLLAPMQVSTVLYVVQRMAMLATVFVFAGVLCYVLGRRDLDGGRRVRGWTLVGTAVLVCWPLATLSKENGIILTALLALVEATFFWRASALNLRRQLRGLFIVVLVVPVILGAGLVFVYSEQLLNYTYRDFSLAERLMTQPRALSSYLLSGLVPGETMLGFFHDDFAPSRDWFDPPSTAAALGLWCGAIAFVLWAISRQRYAMSAFGLGLFVIGHLVEGSLLPLELYFEHRNYLPAAGAAIFVVSLIRLFFQNVHPAIFLLAAAIYLGLLASGTHGRVHIWTSEERIVTSGALIHPRSLRANSAFANVLLQNGNPAGAIEALERALATNPQDVLGILAQTFYVLCLRDGAPAESVYQQLAAGRRIGNVRYIATALGEWHRLAATSGCRTLDVGRIASIYADAIAADKVFNGRRDGWTFAVRYYIGDLLLKSGKPARAAEVLGPAAGGRRVYILMTLAEAYRATRDQSRLEEAVKRLRWLAEQEPFPPEYEERLAQLSASINN